MKKIILATTSPYRQEAFKSAGIEFEAIGSDIDEEFDGRPDNPRELVQELAKRKAQAVAEKVQEGVVIGFDSAGFFDGEIMEKPKTREEAAKRLSRLSGNAFEFHSGIFIIDKYSGKNFQKVVTSLGKFRDISPEEIEKYLSQDDKFNTYAQGFNPVDHYSMTFLKSIEGSCLNLFRSIPLEVVVEMLKEADAIN
jgi:septum formation protein